ncbi:MAG: hypothetical protein FWD19_04260 [Defluviitaleaceae bacterium]|nr:hypothetical protein [Defluviitaleaceae bacterium]
MLNSERETLMYISTNRKFLLSQLDEMEVKTLCQTEAVKIKVMKEGKNLIHVKNHYGNKPLTEIFKSMIDCKLF